MNFDIPPGLTDLLQDFTVSVLRNRPTNLYQFAADYFADAYQHRSLSSGGEDGGGGGPGETKLKSGKGITFGGAASNDLKVMSPQDESSDDEIIGELFHGCF